MAVRVNKITWDAFNRWLDESEHPRPIFLPETKGVAEDLRAEIAADTIKRRLTATALADALRGAGLLDGQAVFAAALYRDWDLPPEPALALLANATVSTRARRLAVLALDNHLRDPRFTAASVAALCSLAARAAGMQAIVSDSAAHQVVRLLDEDERELLGAVEDALLSLRLSGGATPAQVEDRLPRGNPVTEHIRGYLTITH